jgi:hypothetical protein
MELSAIRDAVRQQPFQPFSLRLTDGREVPVVHPEFIAIADTGRRVVVFPPKSATWSVIDPLLVVSIEYITSPKGNSTS